MSNSNDFQKIITALLRGNQLHSPFEVKGGSDENYRSLLSAKLNEYVRRLENISTSTSNPINDWITNHLQDFRDLNDELLRSLDEYLIGSAGKAYTHIENLMGNDFVSSNIIHLKTSLNQYGNTQNHSESLYRVRASDAWLSKRGEMFHIPFQQRYLVGSQRYSIAGLPCLYLGASLYVCWQEMGKPDLNKLYLSHYKTNTAEIDGDVEVLDFAYSLETLKHINLESLLISEQEEPLEKLKAYLAMWPILLSCSFNRQMEKASFNIEYVIPNMILQWIGKEKRPVSGIRYLSTKITNLRGSALGINYVFPPSEQEVRESGFCASLSKMFVLSEPISWQILSTMNELKYQGAAKFNKTDNFERQLVKNYQSTQFYSMENNMKKILSCKKVDYTPKSN